MAGSLIFATAVSPATSSATDSSKSPARRPGFRLLELSVRAAYFADVALAH
jgi:hypothetical protein